MQSIDLLVWGVLLLLVGILVLLVRTLHRGNREEPLPPPHPSGEPLCDDALVDAAVAASGASPAIRRLVAEELLHRAWREEDKNLHEAADADFESVVAQTVPLDAQVKAFYTRVAGTTHKNPNGSSRKRIIESCSVFETLQLLPEPDNAYDPNAIAICRWVNGEQLGFVEARLAGEITRDQVKNGPRWLAIFRHKNISPETDRVVGATIYIIRLSDEFVARKEAESPGSVITRD